MGWVHDVPEDDLYEHEGYAVAVIADGSEPPAVQVPLPGGGTAPNNSWRLYDGSAPDRPLAVGLRAACECGWRGERMRPLDWNNQEGSEGSDVGLTPTGPYGDWLAHIDDLRGTTVPQRVRELVAALSAKLGEMADERPIAALEAIGTLEAVTRHRGRAAAETARERDITWDAIGRALGITRQAAFQRFAKHV